MMIKKSVLLLFISAMRLQDTTVLGQTGICNPETRHACERSGFFRLCRDIGGGRLQAEGPEIACQLWNEQSTCYGGSSHLKTVCGVAPPRCKREGTFLVPGRCRDFYICKYIGSNHFQQFLGECLPDHIFNVMKSECIVDVGDGCSLYTTSSCSSTTIEMTTINIPSSTFSITNTFPETEKTTPVTTHVTTTQEPMTSTSRQTSQESTTQQETTLGQTSSQSQTTLSSTTGQQETTLGQTSSQSQTTPSSTTRQQETTLGQTSSQSQTTPSSTTRQQETTLGQTSTEGQSTQGSTIMRTEASTQGSTTLGTTTDTACIEGARMPDLTNCHKFFKCQNSAFVPVSCPFTYVYHIPQQICKPTTDCGLRPM